MRQHALSSSARLAGRLILIGLVAVIVGGCGRGESLQDYKVEDVVLVTQDGVRLAGVLYLPDDPDVAVVLAHQGTQGADQETWSSFAEYVAGQGIAALTFDFRGIGSSGGEFERGLLAFDVYAAVDFLRAQRIPKVACIGASMGGTSCLRAAIDKDLVGVVSICSGKSLAEPTWVLSDDFPKLDMPKLFVATEEDVADGYSTGLVHVAKNMFRKSPEPKDLRVFPGTAHGTELFHTEHAEAFRQLLVDFLLGLR